MKPLTVHPCSSSLIKWTHVCDSQVDTADPVLLLNGVCFRSIQQYNLLFSEA